MTSLLVNIVREMSSVPDHHVLVANVLPVDEAVDIGCEWRSNGNNTVVDLRLAKTQDPNVAAPEVTCDAVFPSRDQVVGIVGLRVPNLPPSASPRWTPPHPKPANQAGKHRHRRVWYTVGGNFG